MSRLHSARLAKSALLAGTALPLEATEFHEPAAKPTGARILPTELWEMVRLPLLVPSTALTLTPHFHRYLRNATP